MVVESQSRAILLFRLLGDAKLMERVSGLEVIGGIVRLERDGLLERLFRGGSLVCREVQQKHSVIVIQLRIVRLQVERLAHRCLGLLEAALLIADIKQIPMGHCQTRFQRQRFL